ncbi:DUF721 domain-containing protein [bacterium AH-315-E10]|nr:DUF721 domain-containing protein [bacterium AH-315-E10]
MKKDKKDKEWLTPRDHKNRSHKWRQRSRNERARESLFRDWYGVDLGRMEVEGRQEAAKPMSELIDNVLDAHASADHRAVRHLTDAWSELIGPELSSHCSPRSIKRKILLIEVPNSGWLFRLQQIKGEIFRKLEPSSENTFTSIQFVAGGKS